MSGLQNATQVGEIAIDVLEFLAGILHQGPEASTFVNVSRAILHAVEEYKAGRLTADEVRQEIAHFQQAVAANDAAADAALKAKFPGGDFVSQAEAVAREIAHRYGGDGWLKHVEWQDAPAQVKLVVNCMSVVPNVNAFGPYRGIPVLVEGPAERKVC